MNIILLIRLVLSTALILAVAAPFTFLVPKPFIAKDAVVEANTAQVKKVKKAKKVKISEKPLHQVNLPDFAAINDIPTKKRQFFAFIRPAIENKNNQLAKDRTKLEQWHEQLSLGLGLTTQEEASLQKLVANYRINEEASRLQQIDELLVRVDIIPTALVLVQAANESAWGSSRFARVGLNFFGIWCYNRGCGMVPGGRDTGAKHEVAAFDSVDAAVSGYFNNINKHNAYHVFRTIRSELRAQDKPLDAKVLAAGLLPYSERGEEYISDITDMLRHNKHYLTETSI
ncbi:glucosaminidase domain-containing protein [Colwellia ponticola]|uniref:Glucosaminidase n=1 Tax=Colwellia ponticola TaxID=2304625 RepID=A0A8H2PLK1_9GAMM|nr:glucosaminidase domain-containing protein [Colwellia ponticola]TMM44833.1 glucosaminidase [Colwellia ponticola]